MYTPQEQATINEHMTSERSVTMALYGISERNLSPEIEDALTRYVNVHTAVYLAMYGPDGPRGNHLRMETDAEAAARWALEEAIKPPYQKTLERIEELARATWCELSGKDKKVHVRYVDEETSDFQLSLWREYVGITQETRIFESRLSIGFPEKDCLEAEVFIAMQPDDSLEVLQCRCIAAWVDDDYYHIDTLTSEARDEIKGWHWL